MEEVIKKYGKAKAVNWKYRDPNTAHAHIQYNLVQTYRLKIVLQRIIMVDNMWV